MTKRILITGSSGFVGSHLARYYLNHGYEVISIAHDEKPVTPSKLLKIHDKISWCRGDLLDEESVKRVVADYEVDEIIHAGALPIVRVGTRTTVPIFDINIMGTVNVLEAAKEQFLSGYKIKMLFVSSDKSYGDAGSIPYHEKMPLNALNPYEASKACFTSQMKVLTENGKKTISRIKVGERVWTHTGQLKKVTRTFRRRYTGELLTIRIASQKNELIDNVQLTCTPNHPILTENGWKPASELKSGDKVAVLRALCKHCGKPIPFYHKFCSQRCGMEYRIANGLLVRGRKPFKLYVRKCLNCNREFTLTGRQFSICQGKFCSHRCSSLYRKEHLINPSEHGEWYKGFRGWRWKEIRKRILKRDKYTCQLCGQIYTNSFFLVVHHIHPFHNFKEVEKANAPENLITLCRFCHPGNELLGIRKLLNDGKLHTIFTPIKWIKKYNRSTGITGPKYVYNLEVEEDHSYFVHGIAVHNCGDLISRCYYNIFKLPVAVVRCCNIFGEADTNDRLIPNSIKKCLKGEAPVIYKGITYVREFIYADDACVAMKRVLDSMEASHEKSTIGQAYNVGSGYWMDQEECIKHILKFFPKLKPVYREPPDYTRIEIPFQRLDATKIKRELGWKAEVSFHEGLKRTIQWYRENT